MPDGGAVPRGESRGSIGPNAILQLEAPLDAMIGRGVMAQLLDLCRVPMPSGQEMIPEESALAVHHALWQLFPDRAQRLSEQAGQGTARYIVAHRIPGAMKIALRHLPRGMGERLLTRAIARHAWTFCGSGHLTVERRGPEIHFMIRDNPLADDRSLPPHPCHWHAAVFSELFTRVLGRSYHCVEATCCGCGGDLCRFVLRRGEAHGHFKGLEL